MSCGFIDKRLGTNQLALGWIRVYKNGGRAIRAHASRFVYAVVMVKCTHALLTYALIMHTCTGGLVATQ